MCLEIMQIGVLHLGSAWNDGGAPQALHWLHELDGLYDAWQLLGCCESL